MFVLLTLTSLALAEPAGKELPPVKDPDWQTWKDVDAKAKEKAAAAWAVLSEYRPDREFKTAAEQQEAEKKVDAAYKTLDDDPNGACAAGAEILRTTKEDWQRLMVATTVAQLGKETGEPFLIWAMANSTSVDESFEPIFDISCKLASRRKPEHLPALFLILRTHDGHIFLRLHTWYIRTHDCLYYVFGRYGRDVVPYLYPMLKHKDPYVRRNAAIVLGFFMDKPARPLLLKMLEDNDVGSGGAAFALGQLGGEDSVKPIAAILKNPDARTRFWAAYALYELGSKDAVPALEKAAESEKDANTLGEMKATIAHLKSDPKPLGGGAVKLSKDDLNKALAASKKANGLEGKIDQIAASAGAEELDELEAIRVATMSVPSDKGNKWFEKWTEVIRTVRRRVE